MRSSIIIAAHQEGDLLGKTIEACLRTCADLEYEIIVADDASTDGSVDDADARFPQVRIVRHEERRGVSPTKDLGARRATGDVLVFLDAHCNPEPGAILRLVEDIELLEGRAVVTPATPTLCQKTWRNLASPTGHGFSFDLETFTCGWLPLDKLRKAERRGRTFYESPALIGCAFAAPREVYDAVWGFDPAMQLWGVEDLDFSLKCWLLGYPILHDPAAVVGHRFQDAFCSYRVSALHVLVNQRRTAYKNLSLSNWPQWLRLCRERYTQWNPEQPEGSFAAGWHLFEASRESADRERVYLSARRLHDDMWYIDRFALPWPRLGARTREMSLPVILHPFAEPGPSPAPCDLAGITPSGAVVCVDEQIAFGANGTNLDEVAWSAPGANPDTGTGTVFTTKWDSPGTQFVNASCSGTTKTAVVTVIKVEITDDVGDVLTGNQETVVGKRVSLHGKVTPVSAIITSESWSIDGEVVKNYTQTTASAQIESLGSGDTDSDSVIFYWIAGANAARVVYTVSVEGHQCSASLTYNVLRPTAVLNYTLTADNPPVQTSDFGFGEGIVLHFGSKTSPGIRWDATVTTPAGGEGQLQFTQLINSTRFETLDNGNVFKRDTNGYVLDDPNPYSGAVVAIGDSDTQMISQNDSPWESLVDEKKSSADDIFIVYLMYQPTGGILVTLRDLSWHWKGAATKDANGDWSIDAGSSDSGANASSDSTSLPIWSNYFTNVRWLRQ